MVLPTVSKHRALKRKWKLTITRCGWLWRPWGWFKFDRQSVKRQLKPSLSWRLEYKRSLLTLSPKPGVTAIQLESILHRDHTCYRSTEKNPSSMTWTRGLWLRRSPQGWFPGGRRPRTLKDNQERNDTCVGRVEYIIVRVSDGLN